MKNYERVTPHDRVEMLNFNQYEDMARFYMYALRCFDLENQIENGELLMREETINTTVVTHLQTKIQDLEKENAELKARLEKAVELPRIIHPNPKEWHIQYQYQSGIISSDIRYSETKAEARLAELQEGKK